MQTTPLINSLAEQIMAHIRAEGLGTGERLIERRLAEQFRVSRTPIRNALKLLHENGVLEPQSSGGYQIANAAATINISDLSGARDDEEAVYLQIADDRLNARLPQRITENELLRRYDLTRARLASILRRMTNEGWIERLPGHGWEFLPVLTSLQAYEDSYRFRLLIEPAALLEPNWTLDRPALERRREQQQWLADGGIWEVTGSRLFELNSGMHESIIECSRNSFFIDALKRVDRLRRLIDYRQMLDRESARGRCLEHLELLDLLLANKNVEASAYMRRHLSELSTLKVLARESR